MGNVNDKYELIVLCNDQVNGNFSTFSQSSFYWELTAACKALVALDNDKFDENVVNKKQNSLLFQDAMVYDAETHLVVAAKHFLQVNDIFGLDPGVYIRINLKLLTPQHFERMTGFKLRMVLSLPPRWDTIWWPG